MIHRQFETYQKEIFKILENEKLRIALDRALTTFSASRKIAIGKLPHYEELTKKAKAIKEYSIDHIQELIKEVQENIEALGGYFYLATTTSDCVEYISKVCAEHEAKLVVKSKSMTTDEIFLNEALIAKGMQVIETDLGEYIVQLRGEKPSHMVGPSIHVPKEEVADLFSRITGKRVPSEIPVITSVVRELLREKFVEADIGITGANVISADTGTLFLIENEGNVRYVSNAPPVHICVAGIEKLVPTVEDAVSIMRIISVNATGQVMPSYISAITGPSRTADIEMTLSIGMHGPKELHLVLLDNGRSQLARDPDFKQALYCVRCGACSNECPVYREVAYMMGYRYTGGIGIIFTSFFHGLEYAYPSALTCLGCGRCKEICPLSIDIPTMIEKIHQKLIQAKCVAPPSVDIINFVRSYGNPFGSPVDERFRG